MPKTMFAKCQDCGQKMKSGNACTKTTIKIDGEKYDRITYEHDGGPIYKYCHDCNTSIGGLHHLGCDMEDCPKCGGQLISCGCWEDDE